MMEAVAAHRELGLAAAALSSLFWTLAYALILARAAADRAYGMPPVALAANLAWEVTFLATTLAHGAHDVRLALLLPWTLLDLGLLWQCLRYGPDEREAPLASRRFRAEVAAVLVMAAAVLTALVREMRDAIGWYAAFGQNLMMSALFIGMLRRRRDLRGQSLAIGVSKLLGTFFAFVLAAFWSPPSLHAHWDALLPERYAPVSPLLVTLYAVTFVLDVAYVALLVEKSRALGVGAWRLRASAPAGPSASAIAASPADQPSARRATSSSAWSAP